jgi:hypothetical protein
MVRQKSDIGTDMKTLKIQDETHTELTRIVGELTARNGSQKTYDETIMELIQFWRKNRK